LEVLVSPHLKKQNHQHLTQLNVLGEVIQQRHLELPRQVLHRQTYY
jgi:hypothetical protein